MSVKHTVLSARSYRASQTVRLHVARVHYLTYYENTSIGLDTASFGAENPFVVYSRESVAGHHSVNSGATIPRTDYFSIRCIRIESASTVS